LHFKIFFLAITLKCSKADQRKNYQVKNSKIQIKNIVKFDYFNLKRNMTAFVEKGLPIKMVKL
jgi:hypothetical protein